ncbi:ribonucleoside triphosphate reductase [Halorhabdus sp. CBA1104]|uniref:ribonucleoside triphosphate reductase n=1 Tax=Halorhabdus sp. CBA1104 TaxID=1380432 RepID=UPI0012B31F4F|nr:ribonucleoside triphosphate reductase [Halorhabdus sp. CBA1104]QGN08030.1 ribonucleoside triphosphate reductase [Halorhabdus sp. CBA1104]
MLEEVRKRDGSREEFEQTKVTTAIQRAFDAAGVAPATSIETLTEGVVDRLDATDGAVAVETIQDHVERTLVAADEYEAAKRYILYRHRHAELRDLAGLVEQGSGATQESDQGAVDAYVDREDWRVRENSNMDYSLQGLNIHLTERTIEDYWLEEIYSTEVAQAHESGALHIHDLGVLGPYCVGWDIEDILREGLKGVRGKVESAPAKHFDVALMQLVNFLYTLQGEAAGAQALSNFDTYLAPFVRADDLAYDDVRHQLQQFIFNLNVPTRVGFQAPFTNLSMDLTVPDHLADKPVVIGGQPQDSTYGDFQAEVDMINRAFAEVMLEGDAKGRPFTFPIPTYSITEDFEWDNETLDPVWEMTAKYGTPYFSNFVNSEMDTEDARSMCCRLRLDNRELETRGGGLFGSNPLTGSIGVVTINLPQLGHRADDEGDFYDCLESLLDVAKRSLETKREVLERYTERGLYPYAKFYLRNVKAAQDSYWANHFSTIGLIGTHEALLNLRGPDAGIDTPEGKQFAEDVLEFMREHLREYQAETGHMYNLEATPAEGSSYRLARRDREQFPDLRVHATDRLGGEEPIYTNSTQLPFGAEPDLFDALDHQDDLQTKYTGGTVFHGWLGEQLPSPESTKQLVKTIAENYELPYYTLTPTFSVCPTHGYHSGEHEDCPECGESCEVYSRVVGYLRPTENWNPGKQAEFDERADFRPSVGD